MQVSRLTEINELEALAGPWNAMAGGIPFRRHEWLVPWWRHYRAAGELYTLCVRDDAESLVGIAPLYLRRSALQGRVLQLLGNGEVCSDYVGILCQRAHSAAVAAALAEWLCEAAADRHDGWDSLELQSIDAHDQATAQFIEQLARRRSLTRRGAGLSCWRLELPSTWADYEASLSKSHRKQVRRLIDRTLDAGRAVLHTVSTPLELQQGRQLLIDLHQRRRNALGERGCFSSPAFAAFHEEAMQRFLSAGLLRLHWLELEGQPAAAEYHVAGEGVIYGYQAGVAPELMPQEPGRLAAIGTLRLAIEQGYSAFDFLRGDEPYKAHFRASPREMVGYRIAPPRPAAHLRHRAWNVAENLKNWVRAGREDAKPGKASAKSKNVLNR